MKTKQFTTSLPFFKAQMLKKYDLHDYIDVNKPVLFFGMYTDEDLRKAENHNSHAIIVWCGSDSKNYLPDNYLRIKALNNTKHIAMSEFVSDSLKKFDIDHVVLPITPTMAIKNRKPRGENVYAYVDLARSDQYGFNLMAEIQEKIIHKIIIADHLTYSRLELNQIYESCFVGLRLTKHDGLPNTAIELGLMGRNCIYNGRLPNAIPYTDVDSIVDAINKEYEQRHRDNQTIVNETFNFLDIGDKWLNIEL